MARDTLTIRLDGNLTLDALSVALGHFRGLINELTAAVSEGSPITWLVDDLEVGSAIATIRGTAGEPTSVERVVAAYQAVGHSLETGQPIPYGPRVVKEATELAGLINGRIRAITFQTDAAESVIEKSIDVATNPDLVAYGAIEGRVQKMSARTRNTFTLYDSHFDEAVLCYLSPGMDQEMLGVWKQRARVEGLIARDGLTGRPRRVTSITRVELLHDVPAGNYLAARAILSTRPDDPTPEVIIRRIRDAS